MDLDKFDDVVEEEPEDEETLFYAELTKIALKGKNQKFEFIRCWEHRKIVKTYAKALKIIIRKFKFFRKLQRQIIASGHGVLLDLILLKQFDICVKYFTKERAIIKDMLSEYREYVCSGHLIDTFIWPRMRAPEELVDYRKLPGVWMFKKPY